MNQRNAVIGAQQAQVGAVNGPAAGRTALDHEGARRSDPTPLGRGAPLTILVVLVGLGIGVALILSMLQQADGDPFVLAAVSSEQDFPRDFIESELGRPIVTRPALGHDGQSFFLQSLDPFYRSPMTLRVDNPIYRGQRLIYPLLAGLGGTVPLRLVPWGMVAVQLVTFGFGTWATSEVAAANGRSTWWGLAFPLNPGTWAALHVGGASSLALAFGIAAVVAIHRNRMWTAAFLLALSALTREVMLAMAVGLVLQQWRRSGILRPQLLLVPGGLTLLWGIYLRWRIDETFPTTGGALDMPFSGLTEAFSFWKQSPTALAFGLITLAAAVVVLIGAVATEDLLAAAAAPFALLLSLLAIGVLRQNFDFSRAVIPLYTSATLVVLAFCDSRTTANETAESL